MYHQTCSVVLWLSIRQAFHVGNERDSLIAAQMARSMQQDSLAMKAISILGLVYLPGAFVSVSQGGALADLAGLLT